jgi:hypothetical protein
MGTFSLNIVADSPGSPCLLEYAWRYASGNGPKGNSSSNGEVLLRIIERDKELGLIPTDASKHIAFPNFEEADAYRKSVWSRGRCMIDLSQHRIIMNNNTSYLHRIG